jgi:hypothetical protein
VWLDESGIYPAERWEPALQRAIEGSDAFIFVISPDSAASPECRRELEHALSRNKRVIPVVARSTDRELLPSGQGAARQVRMGPAGSPEALPALPRRTNQLSIHRIEAKKFGEMCCGVLFRIGHGWAWPSFVW